MQQGKSPNILKRVTIAPNTPVGAVKTVPINPVNRVQRVMIAAVSKACIFILVRVIQFCGLQYS